MPRLNRYKWAEWAEWTYREFHDDPAATLALDTETTGLGYYDEAFSGQLTWRGSRSGELRSSYFELSDEAAYQTFSALVEQVPTWVFHNAKFDLQKMLLGGIINEDSLNHREIHDTQTQYALLDENGRKGLKDLAVRVLHYDDTIRVPYADKRKKEYPAVYREVSREKYLLDKTFRAMGLKKEDGFHLLPREVVVPYALKDTEFTLQLHEKLYPEVLGKDEALQRLYRSEIELQLVLLRMEADGFRLDVPYVEEKSSEYGVRVMERLMGLAELSGRGDFNPNAWQQVQAAIQKMGTKLPDTQDSTLRELIAYKGPGYEFAEALIAYRADKKIHDYLSAIQRERRGDLIHPNFNPTAARTGRMSSSTAKE